MTTITLDDLNRADRAAFLAALGGIYEHSPWVTEAAYDKRPFASLAALHAAMTEVVRTAPPAQRSALIAGHPDLAGKAALAGELTLDSKAEQSSAGLDRLDATEYATFHRLNDAYRAKFGFPFIVCVRRHGKASILREFERRLALDKDAETQTTLAEIARIVALRLDLRVKAPDRLKVHGRLSTHVLDNVSGRPAAGVAISLWELDDRAPPRLLIETLTNADGRTDVPLMAERPLPIATYELRFAIGTYFIARRVPQADPAFLDIVPIRFSVAEPEGHYHIPLLATPWSYSTYRGS